MDREGGRAMKAGDLGVLLRVGQGRAVTEMAWEERLFMVLRRGSGWGVFNVVGCV